MDREDDLLTTRQAARLLGVGPTSVKRWADSGVLGCVRTPGRHRRFPRRLVEAMLDRPGVNDALVVPAPPEELRGWLDDLLSDHRAGAAAARMKRERERLGTWWRVAAAVAGVLEEIGTRWQRGLLSILDEHLASERLRRAIASCSEPLQRADGPLALLMVAEGDQHTLGLALAELCLREAGWATRWAGRGTPVAEVQGYVERGAARMVAVSASAVSSDAAALRAQANALASACRAGGAHLVLGGDGAWPEPPEYGDRVRGFAELHELAARSLRSI